MPKTNIDWSKLIIYKIICKDKNVSDVYVGRTTDFIRRKYCHQSNCKKSCGNDECQFLYMIINKNGGWSNWDMEIIESFPCNNSREADDREDYWINTLEATLNVKFNYDKVGYKKEWYFKNREKIRLKQKEYRDSKMNEKKEYQELFKINYENENENPEWFLNNVKKRIIKDN